MDNLIYCARCNSDACYVQEVNDKIKNYHCYGCGFQTNSLMMKNERYFKEQLELLPNLYKELMGEDYEGKIWMPSMVNLPKQGEEKSKYPIPGKENEFYEIRMDMETLTEYEEHNYMDALEYIGVFENQE